MEGEREIWFYRILWGYTPVHWKGWLVLFGFVTFILAGSFGGKAVLDALGLNDADWIPFPLFWLTGFIPLMMIAHRHSR
ncbi:MAG: hypothetical protein V4564_12170 [Pseudomonadota bacterium]|uniref:hypothetical protein n=1 Tax=Sphingomonas sp. ERG5 TaxID=1381597 RepID=UPI00054BE671|nr:hypothetical protein [Sphingomonas sp. ERG5]